VKLCPRTLTMPRKAEYSHDIREVSTPLCGRLKPQPASSKGNPLLVKDTLGTVRATTYDLPSKADFQHEYGLRQHRDGVTSGHVLGGWAQFDSTANQIAGRDFKALNAMAVVAGKKTSKQMSEFRRTHDARLKLGGHERHEVKPYDDNTVFGRSSAASTPFNDLMNHGYRFDWMATQPPPEEMHVKKGKPTETNTSRLMAETARKKLEALEIAKSTISAPEEWKMDMFKRVPAKLGPTG